MINISTEMVEAGLAAKRACQFHQTDERKEVVEVFRAMHKAHIPVVIEASELPEIRRQLMTNTLTVESVHRLQVILDSHDPYCVGRIS
jgi:hypothetical protein